MTAVQRDAPYVIADLDDPHELAIKDDLKEYYDREVHHNRLYPDLEDLSTFTGY